MKTFYLSIAVSLSLLLVDCGGNLMSGGDNGGGSAQSPPIVTSFAESWHFASASNAPSIEAALTLSSSSVAGVAHFRSVSTTSPPCPTFEDSFPLSGTIDGQGNLSVTSSPVSGLVLIITGVFASDRASVSGGSYHFTGACAAEETGTLTGAKVKPLTGLFIGTMQGAGNSVTISTQLTQTLTSDKDGFFPVAGTFAVANMCDETFTLNGASVVGDFVRLYSNTGTGLEALTGVMDPGAQQIELGDYPYSDDCIAGAHGLVTRQ